MHRDHGIVKVMRLCEAKYLRVMCVVDLHAIFYCLLCMLSRSPLPGLAVTTNLLDMCATPDTGRF
jgi:hypothetical protein